MPNKDFKVKNKLQVAGITSAGPIIADASGNLDSTAYIATQYGGTGTSTSPSAGQVLYSSGGTTYTPTTFSTLPGTYAVGNTASRPGSPTLGQIYSNTQTGYIEVYTSSGWSQLGVIPTSATIGTATDVGTNRNYNDAAVDVTFTPGAGGGLVTSYTAISSPSGITGSATSSPVRITGLTQGTSYTFTVTATNGYGNALASSSSNSVTPTSVPQTPTIGSPSNVTGVAYGSTCSASVPVTANATGGKSITGFTVTSSPGGFTGTSTSPVTVAGLTSGTSYTFTAIANNANGSSTATSASGSLIPSTVPQTPTIGTATRVNNTTVSLSFTANNTGNSSITSYVVTSNPSISLSTSGTTSPLTVTGSFAEQSSYTFTIKAVNANGSSLDSASSNSLVVALLPTLSSFTASTDWPGTYGLYNTHSTSTTGYAYAGGGTNGQVNESTGYYWNSSNNAWGNKNLPSALGLYLGSYVNTGSGNLQLVSSSGNVTYYSTDTGSWSAGTAIPDGSGYYLPVGFKSTGSIQLSRNSSPFTTYYRTGTGTWTTGTSAPAATDAAVSAGNGGAIFPYGSTGTNYFITSLNGGFTATTSPGAYYTGGNTQNHMWRFYDGINQTIYCYTISGITAAGTVPNPGFSWDNQRIFGTSTGEFHIWAGRNNTNPPNPSYPGTKVHYKANLQ